MADGNDAGSIGAKAISLQQKIQKLLADRPGGYAAAHANANVTIDGNIVRETNSGIYYYDSA